MVSGDEHDLESLHEEGAIKKRRLYGACDMCRKKKKWLKLLSGSDSSIMPGNQCSNCITFGSKCEHSPRRTKAQEREYQRDSYIQTLETRLSKLEQALRSYNHPLAELTGGPLSAFESPVLHPPSPSSFTHSSPSSAADLESEQSEAGNTVSAIVTDQFQNLSLDPYDRSFYRFSIPFMLMRHAAEMKKEVMGDVSPLTVGSFGRPVFWDLRPWERAYCEADIIPSYIYPDVDLLYQLIDLYFKRVNLFLPILHQPTLENLVSQGYHLRDPSFGTCVLLVCAVASRHTDDPRVLLDEEINMGTRLSSGWKYFVQVPMIRRYILEQVGLYDLHYYCLTVQYLIGSGVTHAAWNILGIGIRIALERGLHKSRRGKQKPTVEDELYKRAFWALVVLDRVISSISGRPLGLHDEDFDIELPVECDDDYWEIDERSHVAFNQPSGKPSRVTAFIAHLRLTEILVYSMRTLHSARKSRTSQVSDEEWEQRIVAEVDSAMNQWKDSLPNHLKWDPRCEDARTFEQMAVLHSLFYQLQIQVHRPFIQKDSPLSLSSTIICTNAARSCARISEAQIRRNAPFFPQNSMTAFIAGVILLLNLWIGKRAGVSVAPEKAMADIDRCLYVLKTLENRWQMAGRLWDILHGLATMRSDAIPAEHVSRKRSRQSQLPNPVEAHDVGTNSKIDAPLSPIASAPPHLDTHFGYGPGITEMAALNLSSGSDSNQMFIF
ncbi:fungal-specific transcription factor domain-containing protein [Amanita rubescens]|nr:fungal-specific transcription factor domain-containing protein [Amanita rubescens]